MKKIFVAILVAATLVACAKEDVISQNNEAIGFKQAFVDNSVRSVVDPSLTATTLTDFAVYGFVEDAVLFDGTRVAKVGSTNEITNADLTSTNWKYEGTQYWIAGANYNFNAVAPLTGGNWIKNTATKDGVTLSFTNNGTTDLLYAKPDQIQGETSGNQPVAFTFRHTLSKVKFSFKNAYNVESASIRVYDIELHNANVSADVALTAANTVWSNWGANTLVLDFGNATDNEATTDAKENVADVDYKYSAIYESQNELFLIPATAPTQKVAEEDVKGFKVTFKVDLLVNGTKVAEYDHTAYANFDPVAGNSYDILAEVTAENIDPDHAQEPIEFTVNPIGGWTENDVTM